MIKYDLDALKFGFADLQQTTAEQGIDLAKLQFKLKKIIFILDEQGDKIDDLEDEVTGTLDEIQTTVEAIEHPCGSSEEWIQVVNFDMTDPAENCPSGWALSTFGGLRTCGRQGTASSPTCYPATFQFPDGDSQSFSKVCGRVKAFAYGGVDAFETFSNGETTITSAFVSGVVLLADSPPEHLWTFAAGLAELGRDDSGSLQPLLPDQCPCDRPNPSDIPVPDFVGNNYFCESGINIFSGAFLFQSDDPLWDGKNCNPQSNCCKYNRPPYFMNHLASTITVNEISARICLDGAAPASEGANGDDVLVEQIELYVAP